MANFSVQVGYWCLPEVHTSNNFKKNVYYNPQLIPIHKIVCNEALIYRE